MHYRAGAGFTIVSAIVLAASASPPAVAAPPTHGPRNYTVVIDKMKFGAVPSGLRAGDVILWVNRDLFRHTATAADHSFDIDIAAGKSGKTMLRKAGTIAVSCKFHPGMKARLIVTK